MLAFCACTQNVLIGRNPSSPNGDAGVDAGPDDAGFNADSGSPDSGVSDSGVSDSGVSDSGVSDSGVSDSGVSDSGVSDSGVSDSGVSDSGVSDSGVSDSGVDAGAPGDGGPPELVLVFNVPLCAEQDESVALDLQARNEGGSPVSFVTADVTLPAGTIVQSAPACTPSGTDQLSCDAGQIDPGTARAVTLVVRYPAVLGTRYYGARLTSPAVEDAGNNTLDVLTAITGAGVVSIDPTVGLMDAGACFGTVMSYADCTLPSLVRDTLDFFPDAGAAGDDGTPVIWHASPAGRNLCMRSFGPTGGSVLWGVSINSRCFEGMMDDWETLQSNIGAWRGCF